MSKYYFGEEQLEKILLWLRHALEADDIQKTKAASAYVKTLILFYLNEMEFSMTYEEFILDTVARVYDEDYEDEEESYQISDPTYPAWEFGKIVHLDEGLQTHIGALVNQGQTLCGQTIAPTKIQYLRETLHYAKNFHPNYFPEQLLES